MENKEPTEKEIEKFAVLMKNYSKRGGPIIHLDMSQIWPEWEGNGYDETRYSEQSVGSIIKDAVQSEIQRRFYPLIKQAAEGAATRYIHERLDFEIENRFNKLFTQGFTEIQEVGEGDDKEEIEVFQLSVSEYMQNTLESFFVAQPNNRGKALHGVHRTGERVPVIGGLHSHCDKLVREFLENKTKEIIEDVNKTVLEEAKKSISLTVSEQLFSGLNLLPKIGGVKQS